MIKTTLEECGDRGWFIGNFPRAVFKTDKFEVCYQINERQQTASHYHAQAHEITLVISGSSLVNGQLMKPNDIFVLEPGEYSQIEYLELTEVVTIKTPSVPNDKHYL